MIITFFTSFFSLQSQTISHRLQQTVSLRPSLTCQQLTWRQVFSRLSGEVDTVTPEVGAVTPKVAAVTSQVGAVAPQVGAVTPQINTVTSQVNAITPQSPTAVPATPNSAMETVSIEVPVGEEVIRSCVTPRKIHGVQEALRKEEDRHRCAVRLLPYFFSKEELSNSNTDGTHGKQCLDSSKLNSIKVFVFSKFPVESAAEKDRLWRFIKTKINARCRASKFATRDH